MANQQNSYTGSQGTGTNNAFFDFTFPSFTTSEVKVEVDNVVKTLTTHYTVENYNTTSGGKVKFTANNIPTGTTPVRIFRQTDVDSPKAEFTAGASLKAGEINDNFKQLRHALQEAIGAAATDRKVQEFNIEDGAITSAKIKDLTIVENDIANSAITTNKIATDAVTTDEILNGAVTRAKLEPDIIDGTKIEDDSINSEHYAAGSIDLEHLAVNSVNSDKIVNGSITGTDIGDDEINSQHYAAGSIDLEHMSANSVDSDQYVDGSIDNEHYAAGSITADKLNAATVVTNSEQSGYSVNDTSFFTTAAAEARYFNTSTGETIKDGEAFPNNDTTIATTAAINDRIIDILDSTGGFVPLVNEYAIPQYHPEVENTDVAKRVGTIISIGVIAKTGGYTTANGRRSGTTVTISSGDLTNHSNNALITDCSVDLPEGFGVLVETTAQNNSQYLANPTFKFHRLVPKATEVTTVASNATQVQTVHNNITQVQTVHNNITDIQNVAADAADIGAVAAKATEIGRLGTADAVADMAILGTADVVADMAILGTNDVVADLNTLGTADVVADMNTLATADIVSDMNALATSDNITAMDTCRDNISSINNASTNINSINNFGDTYQVASNNPSTDGGGNALAAGDLYFNTSANELKVYNGSSWQGGVTASGSFAATTGNTFTGDNRYNDGVKALFGTGSDLEIFHDGSDSHIASTTGGLTIEDTGGYFRIKGNDIKLEAADGDDFIECDDDAAVSLYYDNSKKFQTESTGVHVTGNVSITGDYLADDNEKLKMGDGHDFLIFHDGSDNHIKGVNDDNLYISTNNSIRWNIANDGHFRPQANKTYDIGSNVQQVKQVHAKEFLVRDDGYFKAGASADLQIYHDSTNSYLQNTTGVLYLNNTGGTATNLIVKAASNIELQPASGETGVKAIANGAVELYNDNSKKLATYSGGVNIYGRIAPNEFQISDNEKAYFGTDNDLEIYQSGTNGFITNTSGSLNISTAGGAIDINKGSSEYMGRFLVDGAVELYHNNSKKIETTSSGVTVTGTVAATSYTGDGSSLTGINTDLVSDTSPQLGGDLQSNGNQIEIADDDQIRLGTSNDLTIFHESSSNFNVFRQNNALSTKWLAGSDTVARFMTNGACELYYDNSKKINTNSNGVAVHGDMRVGDSNSVICGAHDDIQIFHSPNNGFFKNTTGSLYIQNATQNTSIYIRAREDEESIKTSANSNVELYFDNSKKFETTTNGAVLTGSLGLDELYMGDNEKIKIGAEDDLQIYHDGSAGRIHSASHPVYIRSGGQFGVFAGDGTESRITTDPNGDVKLYYDNNVKLRTTPDGIILNGVSDISHSSADNLQVGTGSGSNGITIYSGTSDNGSFYFADGSSGSAAYRGFIEYNHNADALYFGSAGGTAAYFDSSRNFLPNANNSRDLGSSSVRWRNIYTNDLNLSNEGSSNDIDSTWGDWTIQEGESDLFLKNNRSGKKYKFNLTEVS